MDCTEGNSKTNDKFWGQIAATFNSTTEPHRQRTAKQLKDHWGPNNTKVTKFNSIYIQQERARQSGADDAMIMQNARAIYAQREGHEFNLDHWWEAVRHQPKWKSRPSCYSSTSDGSNKRSRRSGEYSSAASRESEEEVARPIGRDRSKAAARREKAKGKAASSSGSDAKGMGKMLKRLCKVGKQLVETRLLRQWSKLKDRPTENMSEEEKRAHMRAIRKLEKKLQLDKDDDEDDDEEAEDDSEEEDDE